MPARGRKAAGESELHMAFSLKRQAEKWPAVAPGLDEKIPNVEDDARLIKLRERIAALKARLEDVESRLAAFRYRPGEGPPPKTDVEAGVRQLLACDDIPELDLQTLPLNITKEKMFHERRVIQAAIKQVEHEMRGVYRTVGREISESITPEVNEIIGELMETAGAFDTAIKKWGRLIHLLDRRGIKQSVRPGAWLMWPRELVEVAGGECPYGLEFYITQRSESLLKAAKKARAS